MAADRAQAVGVQQRPELLPGASEQPGDLDLAVADLGQQRERAREVGLRERADGEQLDADPMARHQSLAAQRRRGQRPKTPADRRCGGRRPRRQETPTAHRPGIVHGPAPFERPPPRQRRCCRPRRSAARDPDPTVSFATHKRYSSRLNRHRPSIACSGAGGAGSVPEAALRPSLVSEELLANPPRRIAQLQRPRGGSLRSVGGCGPAPHPAANAGSAWTCACWSDGGPNRATCLLEPKAGGGGWLIGRPPTAP